MNSVAHEEAPDPREHIVETAAHLFAALGYDSTPMELIASATGFDVPTITEAVGDKAALYTEVVRWSHIGQQGLLDTVIAGFTPDRAGLYGLVDRFLDYLIEHPELPALVIHSWHSDAADVGELASTYLRPKYDQIRALLQEIAPSGLDVDMTVQTLAWSIRGFCVGGLITAEGERRGPEDPELVKQFRRHLRWLSDHLFELDK
jgi:AcrR family transcriptional regulator